MFSIIQDKSNRLISSDNVNIEFCSDECILRFLPKSWSPIEFGKKKATRFALTNELNLWILISDVERKHMLLNKMKDQKSEFVLELLEYCDCCLKIPRVDGSMLGDINMSPWWINRKIELEKLSHKEILNVILKLSEGLKYLHTSGISHGDVFPFNVMIKDDMNPLWIDIHDVEQLTEETLNDDLAHFFVYIICYMVRKNPIKAAWFTQICSVFAEERPEKILDNLINMKFDLSEERENSSFEDDVLSVMSREDELGTKFKTLLSMDLFKWFESYSWNATENERLLSLLKAESLKNDLYANDIVRINKNNQMGLVEDYEKQVEWRASEQERLLKLLDQEKVKHLALKEEHNGQMDIKNKELLSVINEKNLLADSIGKLQTEIVTMEQHISCKKTEMVNLEQHIAYQEKEINRLVEALQWNEKALHQIYNSSGYKVALKMSAIKNKPKNIMRKIAKKSFDKGAKFISPRTKKRLKPFLYPLYIKLYPEKNAHMKRPEFVGITKHAPEDFTNNSTNLSMNVISEGQVNVFFEKKPSTKVNVILPVYNHSDMLEKSIESILNQSYKNIELIIINDGSTDGIEKILDKYYFFPKVKILNQKNQKLPTALNNAFHHARGELFTWTSADNICKPQMIEKLVDFMILNPDVDLTYANYEIIDEHGEPLINTDHRYHNQLTKGSNIMNLPETVDTLGLIEDNFIGAAFIYRYEVAKAIGDYDPYLLGTEDYDYWLRINELFKIKKINSIESLYYYRVHANTLSEKFGSKEIKNNLPILLKYNSERKLFYDGFFDIYLYIKQFDHKKIQLIDGLNKNRNNLVFVNDNREELPTIFSGLTFVKSTNFNSDWVSNRKLTDKAILIFDDEPDYTNKLIEASIKRVYGENIFKVSLDHYTSDASINLGLTELDSDAEWEKYVYIEDFYDFSHIKRKARDNDYYLWDYTGNGEKKIGYFGPMLYEQFNIALIQDVARSRPQYDIILISTDESSYDWNDIFKEYDNVYYLGYKSDELMYYYLSGFDLFINPSIDPGLSREALLYSGKKVLTCSPLFNRVMPYELRVEDKIDYEMLDNLLNIKVDIGLIDKYLESLSSKRWAKWIENAANSFIFYTMTRLNNNKLEKVVSVPAVPYIPDKINLLIEVISLDKGGLEEVVYNTLCNLDRSQFNITVVCVESGGFVADRIEALGINVIILPEHDKWEYYENILMKNKIAVIHQHYSLFGCEIGYKCNIPIIHFLHNSYVWFTDEQANNYNYYDSFVNKYIAVSGEVKKYSSVRLGIDESKIKVIPNGIDIKMLEETKEKKPVYNRDSLGLEIDDFVLLNLASIDGRKATMLLIGVMEQVVKNYPSIKILIAGNPLDITYYESCLKLVDKLNLKENVIFTGFIPEKEDLFELSDVFILPSIIEGWSISKLEAMYAQKPLILTNVGGAEQVIVNNDIGILVPNAYGDVTKLTDKNLYDFTLNPRTDNFIPLRDAIIDMYLNKHIWREKAKLGREKVVNNYGIEKITAKYEKLSLDLMINKRV